MEEDLREITKIAREAAKFTAQNMKEDGIGTAEFDVIHTVRHHPGITQKEVREILGLDKGACARRCARLIAKGYLIRKENPDDKRSVLLYATEKAQDLKLSHKQIETIYYRWLSTHLSEEEKQAFYPILHKLYVLNKKEARSGWPHIREEVAHEKQ